MKRISSFNFHCTFLFSFQAKHVFLFLLFFSPLFWRGGGGEASAQFTDNFNDGDFTNNPAWSGDTSQWVDTLQMLRSNDTVASSKFYLSTSSTLAANAQWEWWDSLSFNTSSANYIDVYLTSDSANLKATSFNGYFVRIGNTSDDISLYKRTGATSTVIIDGINGLLNHSVNVMRIKVTRDAGNLWTLMRDSTGTGSNYVTEGTVTDATFSTSNFFGIYILQSTSSFFKRHWFDNFYAGIITGDTLAPSLVQLTVISSTQLDLKFSETVSISTAQAITNYSVNNGIGNPASAVRDGTDSSMVHLTFSSSFSNGSAYTITVSNVTDLAGNVMVSANKSFTYFVAVPAVFKDVVINEIFADPSPQVGLPNAEFIEIYNRSAKTFNLNGWKFSDGTSIGTLGNYILLPDSFLVLTASTDVALFQVFGSVIAPSTWPSLNNTGDNLTLTDSSGTLVDAVNYLDTWYQDAVKKNGGWTLELINPNNPCSGANNWIASNDSSGGTPDKQNSVFNNTPDTQAPSLTGVSIISSTQIELTFSEPMDSATLASGNYSFTNGLTAVAIVPQGAITLIVDVTVSPSIDTAVLYSVTVSGISDCSGNPIISNDSLQFVIGYPPSAGDVIINEIFADPAPIVALPEAEYVELFNKSNKFLDLSNCTFSGATFPSGAAILPNGYLILTSVTSANLFSSYGSVSAMNGWSSTFLTNSGKDLILSYGTQQIDEVFYDISWYKDNTKQNGGWSLERINPNHPCSSGDNWRAAVDSSGGTPGKINSVYSTAPDIQPPTIIGVTIVSQNQFSLNFSEGMNSASLSSAVFTVTNGISVTNVQAGFNSVLLDVSPALDSATAYTVTVSSASDCSGNFLINGQFQFGIGVNASLHDILIDELYPDPNASVSSLPEVEFVELYNKTSKVINLNGYKFSDGSSIATIGDLTILPHKYLILCSATNVSDYAPYGRTSGLSSFPSLNNAGDNLTLKDANNNLIHEVDYLDTWYGDDSKKNGGWTLEMIDPNNPCGEANNWHASLDPAGGTPGKINSVNGTNPDVSAPAVLGAYAITPLSVIIYFNESLDSLSALVATYSVNNGISVSGIIVLDKKTVRINLTNSLQANIIYTITASGMTDCIGNITNNSTAEFALTEQGDAGDIIINEVLFNPRGSGSDFVEVYNNSQKIINLQNWKLANIAGDTVANLKPVSPLGPMIMFPKDYLVFTKDTANIKSEYPLGKPENYRQIYSLPSYNDDSGTVVLLNNLNVVADAFSYTDKMHFALLKDHNGVSLERIDFNRASSDITNWHSAAEVVGWATPGYRNSQYNPGENTGDNISVNPEIFSPDEDGHNDVVNINYKFDAPGFVATINIYDAKGRLIRALAQNQLLAIEGTYSWDGISDSNEKARLGIYIIFFEAFDLNGKILKFKKTCVLAGKMN